MSSKKSFALLTDDQPYEDSLRAIVEKSIVEESLLGDHINQSYNEKLTAGQRIADEVATFGGSWRFIIIFCCILFCWIVFNIVALKHFQFDPYPFILMNLVLSCLAALQAPIIMMSQNRQAEKDRKQSKSDYLVNLKSEMQIRSLHEKIDVLESGQIKKMFEIQAKQLELLNNMNIKIEAILKSSKN